MAGSWNRVWPKAAKRLALTCLILRCDARRKEMSLVDLMDLVKLGGAYLHDPDVSGVDPVLVKRQEVVPRNSYQNPASV